MTTWTETLQSAGAVWDADHAVAHFGQPAGELAAALQGTILCDLSHLARIEAAGADTVTFLQGQLTNDVKQVSAQRSQLAAWCSVKGRVQALFRVVQHGAAHYLLCPQDRVALVLKRLSLYILRSQVKLRDASADVLCIGIGGAQAAEVLERTLGCAIALDVDEALIHEDVTAVRIAGTQPRFMLLAAPARMETLWRALVAQAEITPAGIAAWELQDITAGLPQVLAPTNEEFLPQMLNLQAINGVSFKKGCYTGQEIVARTQYLGKLKRRLFLARIPQADCPPPGTALFASSGEQSVGQIVQARPHPDGGCACTAVIQLASAAEPVHLGSNSGAVLELLPLPYALPEAA